MTEQANTAPTFEQRIAEIDARATAATDGPWWPVDSGCTGFDVACSPDVHVASFLRECDAAFIAHARTDIPWLIEQVQALAQENAQMRAALEPFAKEAELFWRDTGGVTYHENLELWQRPNHRTPLTVGDLRRAAASMGQKK